MALDAAGLADETVHLGTREDELAFGVASSPEGGFAVVGRRAANGLVVRLDPDLTVTSAFEFGSAANEDLFTAVVVGDIVYAAGQQRTGGGDPQPLVVRVPASGEASAIVLSEGRQAHRIEFDGTNLVVTGALGSGGRPGRLMLRPSDLEVVEHREWVALGAYGLTYQRDGVSVLNDFDGGAGFGVVFGANEGATITPHPDPGLRVSPFLPGAVVPEADHVRVFASQGQTLVDVPIERRVMPCGEAEEPVLAVSPTPVVSAATWTLQAVALSSFRSADRAAVPLTEEVPGCVAP